MLGRAARRRELPRIAAYVERSCLFPTSSFLQRRSHPATWLVCLSPHRDGDSSKNDFKPGFQFDQYGIHLKDLVLALSQTISSPQNEETRSQRFVKSRQVPSKKSTFGDLGSSIDLVNRIEAELVIVCLRILSAEEGGVRLSWAESKPKRPT